MAARTQASVSASRPTFAQNVQVVSSTWGRESHHLYDFESKEIEAKTFTVRCSTVFARHGSAVNAHLPDGVKPPLGAEPLLRVMERAGRPVLDRVAASRPLWMVANTLAPGGYHLAEGAVVKFGGFAMRVRQLVAAGDGEVRPDLGFDGAEAECAADGEEDLKAKPCRICLMEGPGDDDPLVRPCSCRGSIEYVHLSCLRHWTKCRMDLGDSPRSSYEYSPPECEICRAALPASAAAAGGERVPLLELPRTQAPYIVLESLGEAAAARRCFVLSLAGRPKTIGRSHESDLRIVDVSVSRCHAELRFEEGQFILEDNNSRFGTLVELRRPHPIPMSGPISVQVGRTLLTLSVAPPTGAGRMQRPAAAPMTTTSTSSTMAPTSSLVSSPRPACGEGSSAAMPEEEVQLLQSLRALFLARRGAPLGGGVAVGGGAGPLRTGDRGSEAGVWEASWRAGAEGAPSNFCWRSC